MRPALRRSGTVRPSSSALSGHHAGAAYMPITRTRYTRRDDATVVRFIVDYSAVLSTCIIHNFTVEHVLMAFRYALSFCVDDVCVDVTSITRSISVSSAKRPRSSATYY